MASSKSEAQRLLDLIHQERLSEVEKIPPGFLNTKEWAKEWGVRRSSAERFIVIGVEKKLMEKKVFRVATNGRYCRVAYYRATK
jgi:hypothetical protein